MITYSKNKKYPWLCPQRTFIVLYAIITSSKPLYASNADSEYVTRMMTSLHRYINTCNRKLIATLLMYLHLVPVYPCHPQPCTSHYINSNASMKEWSDGYVEATLLALLGSAPCARRSVTISVWPLKQAPCKGVCPFCRTKRIMFIPVYIACQYNESMRDIVRYLYIPLYWCLQMF